MSKLVLIKNLKIILNEGKSNEEVIRFDNCDKFSSCHVYRDLDTKNNEKEYDVKIGFDHSQGLTAGFLKFEDAERLMNDLVAYLQNKDMSFLELDLLNYETK